MAKKKAKLQPESTESKAATELEIPPQSETPKVEDPIGDTTDGEAAAALEAEPKPKRAKSATPRKKPSQPKGASQPVEEKAEPLRAPLERGAYLRATNLSVVNLANNYVGDYGAMGLTETIESLRRAGVGFVGAGANDLRSDAGGRLQGS